MHSATVPANVREYAETYCATVLAHMAEDKARRAHEKATDRAKQTAARLDALAAEFGTPRSVKAI